MSAPTGFTVRTARLTLDAVTPDDAVALHAIVTRPEVGRMLVIFPPGWTVADARAMIPSWAFAGRPDFRLAIRDGGRFVGAIGLRDIGGTPWLAYFVAPSEAGRGLATEAVAAFCDAAEERLELDHIAADVFTDNPASARVLEKCGFVRTGTHIGTSAARLEAAPLWVYRRTRAQQERRP
jgi:RimJ/RimL family protein N-acetyltransferase